jgi:hypothetical protein
VLLGFQGCDEVRSVIFIPADLGLIMSCVDACNRRGMLPWQGLHGLNRIAVLSGPTAFTTTPGPTASPNLLLRSMPLL